MLTTGPGGLEKLQIKDLEIVIHEDQISSSHTVTVGYNVNGHKAPLARLTSSSHSISDVNIADDLCVVHISHFSINYADICIRWGLYESASQYVGYPIVPGV
jgi:synaptic vesicle membrane protein VAT-1